MADAKRLIALGMPTELAKEIAAQIDAASGGGTVSWDDITDKPAFGTAAEADIEDFATAAQGALADTAVQPGDLAPVATSGSAADVTYDNTDSGLTGANVQAAIDEIAGSA